MFERIKRLFMRKGISKVVVDTLREQNSRLKERVAELENATEKKFCPYCKEWKPITEFNKNRSKKDGLQSCCKICHRGMNSKRQKKLEEYKFTPSTKEFLGGYIVISERYIVYQIKGVDFPIIDAFRYDILVDQFGKELVRNKITGMIKYNNKNNLWKENEDLYYKLKARCQKEHILQVEKQQMNLFQNSESEGKTIHS